MLQLPLKQEVGGVTVFLREETQEPEDFAGWVGEDRLIYLGQKQRNSFLYPPALHC